MVVTTLAVAQGAGLLLWFCAKFLPLSTVSSRDADLSTALLKVVRFLIHKADENK